MAAVRGGAARTDAGWPRLVVDMGGTNLRLALAREDGALGPVTRIAAEGFDGFDAILEHGLRELRAVPGAVAVAGAGPLGPEGITLTNRPWRIVAADLAVRFAPAPVRLANDLEAVAHALPRPGPAESEVIHVGDGTARGPRLAINLGTGFGAALAIPGRDGWHVLPTEAGHMTLAPSGAEEAALIGPAETIEDWLAGPGIARLRTGLSPERVRPVFSALLGRVTGDLILATGAWGGVWFCGGASEALAELLEQEAFLAALHRPQPVADAVRRVPVARMTLAEPVLAGLARMPMG